MRSQLDVSRSGGSVSGTALVGPIAYAVSEMRGWNASLESRPARGMGFYVMTAIAAIGGVAIEFVGGRSGQGAVLERGRQGVLAAPLMAVVMLIACHAAIMGPLVLPRSLRVIGWLSTTVIAAVTLTFFFA